MIQRTSVRLKSVPEASLLAGYASAGAFTDCYALTVPGTVTLPAFIEAFYTTRLFKLERWLLAKMLKLTSTDEQAAQLAHAETDRFAAWTVEHRAQDEILLDAGQTRSWFSVRSKRGATPATTLFFGSAVVPARPGGQFGWLFYALLGFHRAYSKRLLTAAARRLGQQSAA